MEINYIQYILYSLIGAILFPLMYHFSLNNKYKICTLIPTIPILGLTGLFFIINKKGNINGYINKHVQFLLCTLTMYLILLTIYYFTKKIFLSIFLALIIWFIIVYFNLT